jgi:hypothetical protein
MFPCVNQEGLRRHWPKSNPYPHQTILRAAIGQYFRFLMCTYPFQLNTTFSRESLISLYRSSVPRRWNDRFQHELSFLRVSCVHSRQIILDHDKSKTGSPCRHGLCRIGRIETSSVVWKVYLVQLHSMFLIIMSLDQSLNVSWVPLPPT